MTLSTTNTRSEKLSEFTVATLVGEFLKEYAYKICMEVPSMGQCADIVCLRNEQITIVEVKLRDWKRALKQCFAHIHVADYICIAIATASVPEDLCKIAFQEGYGIIHFSCKEESCKWVLLPQPNFRVWPPQQRRLRTHFQEISHGG